MSTCEGVLNNVQLMVLESVHGGLVMKLWVKNGPEKTVFVRNSLIMVNDARNGLVMNGFVKKSHLMKR